RKKKAKPVKKDKEVKASSTPDGFWRQATAFVLGAVLAPLLLLAMFGLGGSLPVGLLDGTKWLIGRAAFLAPFVLIFIAAIKFRSDDHKLPRSSFWGVLLFLMSLTGLLHLPVERVNSSEVAQAGGGGGMMGSVTNSILFPLLDTIGT